MWPESGGDAGERGWIKLQNGTVRTNHAEPEFVKALEPESATYLWTVSLAHVFLALFLSASLPASP